MFSLFVFLFLSLGCVIGKTLPNGVSLYGHKIIGGQETTIEKRPYLVSLEIDGSPSCGGVIVDRVTVVTAAHCTDSTLASSIYVRAGSARVQTGGTRVAVSQIIQHPNYHSENEQNDISILKLAQSLSTSSSIAPATLINNLSVPAGTSVVVAGWGVTEETSQTVSPILREVQVEIIDHEVCKNAYRNLREVTDEMMCAGDLAGGKDACLGDSGGALIVSGTNTLVGIVSWGLGCGRTGYPGVYANVQSFVSWIKANSG